MRVTSKFCLSGTFAVATMLGVLGLGSAPAHATFTTEPGCNNNGCPSDQKFFNSSANNDVVSFVGSVGQQSGGPAVTVDTFVNTTTGAGYANIKPSVGGTLNRILFTPKDPLAYSDFSFRGQIEQQGFSNALTIIVNGCIIVSSVCQLEAPQTISLTTDKGANADFSRLAIYSTDGETINSVEVDTAVGAFFNEFKQVNFSPAFFPIPEPGSLALFGAGLAGLGLIRRRLQEKRSHL